MNRIIIKVVFKIFKADFGGNKSPFFRFSKVIYLFDYFLVNSNYLSNFFINTTEISDIINVK